MKNNNKNYILIFCFLLAGIAFVIKFASPPLLKLYIEAGLGNCRKIPILCVKPRVEIVDPVINESFLFGLPYCELYEIQLCVPKDFKVVKQKIILKNYKRNGFKQNDSAIYLLYEKPQFFVNLFPEAQKLRIQDDYEFVSRVMNANMNEMRNFTDAFFVIMKGVFTPDLGDQRNVEIVKLRSEKFKGFISYNLGELENYFDCNVVDNEGNFFKVYIKDKEKQLDLDKVLSIISSMKKAE
jgi:hypothetical protein